jgi:hypothetical protein
MLNGGGGGGVGGVAVSLVKTLQCVTKIGGEVPRIGPGKYSPGSVWWLMP